MYGCKTPSLNAIYDSFSPLFFKSFHHFTKHLNSFRGPNVFVTAVAQNAGLSPIPLLDGTKPSLEIAVLFKSCKCYVGGNKWLG